jgi:hypothetical protein
MKRKREDDRSVFQQKRKRVEVIQDYTAEMIELSRRVVMDGCLREFLLAMLL